MNELINYVRGIGRGPIISLKTSLTGLKLLLRKIAVNHAFSKLKTCSDQ